MRCGNTRPLVDTEKYARHFQLSNARALHWSTGVVNSLLCAVYFHKKCQWLGLDPGKSPSNILLCWGVPSLWLHPCYCTVLSQALFAHSKSPRDEIESPWPWIYLAQTVCERSNSDVHRRTKRKHRSPRAHVPGVSSHVWSFNL